ncbi:FAD-dependent oxidoreductase [Mycobacterium sp. AT1]|uniref:flavin monoamine oxidase family protein n=1 Tax=Mycobacterium sp. AT1 TaxID=1961706 RepID=UPI0009AC4E22|nr:FAD-dependent oxidoreductase [Mycobacterium sp. AT1]
MSTATPPPATVPNVIVVGAGLSGMTAAYTLAAQGLEVIVVEAKDRVGGRTHSDPDYEGGPLDLGGMLIGVTHDRSRRLGETLGLTWAHARPEGRMTYRVNGDVILAPDSSYPTTIDGSDGFDVKLAKAYGKFDVLAARVGADGPWDTAFDRELDMMNVATWLELNVPDPVVRRIVDTDLNIIVGAATSEISMLFWAQYVAKCENMHALQVTANDALWIGGAQQISQRIAEQPGITLVTESPVTSVQYTDDSVTVHTTKSAYTAAHAIIAVPPASANAIAYIPELPLQRRQLQARAPMGRESKVQMRYPSPFWRESHQSGEVFDLDLGYLALDVTRPGDLSATIVAFIGGKDYDAWFALGDTGRRQAVIESLVATLGPAASEPLSYHETDWPSIPYTLGAPVTVMPPGLLSSIGTALNAPIGPLRFAGTEAAPMWTGYMEGAVRAGEAAAQSILDSVATSATTAGGSR